MKYKSWPYHRTPLVGRDRKSRIMHEKGVLTDHPIRPSPAPVWARASAERGSGARIDESSGSRVVAMCLGGLIRTPAIPHGVLDAQVIAPQPYARTRMPPGAAAPQALRHRV